MEEFHPYPLNEMERTFARSWIFNYMPLHSIGAELGVFRGIFSELLLEALQPKKFYMVDPWTKQGALFPGKIRPYTGNGKLTTDYAKKEAILRTQRFNTTEIVVVEDYSFNFLEKLYDETNNFETNIQCLDFIYIDSSHLYENTYQELVLADRVLSDSGIIAGDDWNYFQGSRHHGVFRAVHDFVKTFKYQIIAAGPAKQFILRREPDYQV